MKNTHHWYVCSTSGGVNRVMVSQTNKQTNHLYVPGVLRVLMVWQHDQPNTKNCFSEYLVTVQGVWTLRYYDGVFVV